MTEPTSRKYSTTPIIGVSKLGTSFIQKTHDDVLKWHESWTSEKRNIFVKAAGHLGPRICFALVAGGGILMTITTLALTILCTTATIITKLTSYAIPQLQHLPEKLGKKTSDFVEQSITNAGNSFWCLKSAIVPKSKPAKSQSRENMTQYLLDGAIPTNYTG